MSRPPVEKPQRFYTWHRKVYWTYWSRHTRYNNPRDDNREWHCWEDWSVFFGLKGRGWPWFGYEDLYYDGITCQLVTFCGLVFGRGYGYDANRVHLESAQ